MGPLPHPLRTRISAKSIPPQEESETDKIASMTSKVALKPLLSRS
jgi:hypothetical protein